MRITKDIDTRKEEILKASFELFSREGFEKVTVESITRRVGVAKGSFYNYFKSKEDVYEAVVSSVASQTMALSREVLCGRGSPKERLLRYIDWTFELAKKQEKSLNRVLSYEADKSQQKIYLAALDEVASQMIPLLTDLFEEGMACGDFILPNASYTAAFLQGAFRGVHSQFYKNLEMDMETSKTYLLTLLSRLLEMKHE